MDFQEVLNLANGIFFTTGISPPALEISGHVSHRRPFPLLGHRQELRVALVLVHRLRDIFLVNFPLVPLIGVTPAGRGELIYIFISLRPGVGGHPLRHLPGPGGHDRLRPP